MDGRKSSRKNGGSSRGNDGGTDSTTAESQPQPQSQSQSQSQPQSQSQSQSQTTRIATNATAAHRHNGTENSRETDLLSHAASALRRLHFKSAGGSRSCRTVPKVVVMGSSTASETTINTSTDSANTMLTMVMTTQLRLPTDVETFCDTCIKIHVLRYLTRLVKPACCQLAPNPILQFFV